MKMILTASSAITVICVIATIFVEGAPTHKGGQAKEGAPARHEYHWGETAGGFRLGVRLPGGSHTVRPTEPVALQIKAEVVSDEARAYFNSSAWTNYTYDLVDENHKEVPLTRFGKKHLGNVRHLRNIVKHASKGDVTKDVVYLARLFDLSVEGKYHLTIHRRVLADAPIGRTAVSTSRVTFTVSDGDKTPAQWENVPQEKTDGGNQEKGAGNGRGVD